MSLTASPVAGAGSVFWLTAIVLVLLPLPLGANRAWAVGVLSPLIAAVPVLWAVSVWRNPDWWPVFTKPARIFFSAFALLCLWFEVTRHWVSFDASASQWHANQMWLMLGLCLPLYACLQHNPNRVQTLIWVLVVSAVLQTLVGIVLLVGGREWHAFFEVIPQGLVKGTFVNRNHVAAYFNLALAAGTGLMIGQLAQQTRRAKSSQKVKQGLRVLLEFMLGSKMALRVLLIVVVLGLIGTRSRAGNGIFFAGVLATAAVAMVAYRRSTGNARSRVGIFLTSVVVLDIVVLGAFVGLDRVIERFQTSYVTNQQAAKAAMEASGQATAVAQMEETLQARISPAWAALAALKERPFSGMGGKTFQWVFPAYKDETAVGLHYEHAHNDFIEHAVEGGLVGFGLLACMTLAVLWASLRTALAPGRSLPKGMALGVAMALIMTLAHSTVDFPTQIFAISTTLCALAAAGLAIRGNA